MDYQNIKSFLDALIALNEKQKEFTSFNGQIEIYEPHKGFMFKKGIEIAADLLGVPLECRITSEYSEFKYHYLFTYNGYRFSQFELSPLEGVDFEGVAAKGVAHENV